MQGPTDNAVAAAIERNKLHIVIHSRYQVQKPYAIQDTTLDQPARAATGLSVLQQSVSALEPAELGLYQVRTVPNR